MTGLKQQKFYFPNEFVMQDFASKFAKNLVKGDVLTLQGNLGTGKTTFCRSIIQSICGKDTIVTSPTFNLLQVYDASDYSIYHYDLYRLKHSDEIFELGIEDALNENLTLIEWPELIYKFLPKETITISLSICNGDARNCLISIPSKFFH